MSIKGASGCHKSAGSALLAVLWLTAALSAIAFSLANTMRGETERTSTASDGVRAYYLAAGAIERAILYYQWGPRFRNPDGSTRYYEPPMPRIRMTFPSGDAIVEVIPEASKLNVNYATREELERLAAALGAEPGRAQVIAEGIRDWRTAAAGGSTDFDQHYLSLTPSFRARHASIQEIEEILLVQGVTPDLFYGSYERDGQGRLYQRGGLRDCLTAYAAHSVLPIDVNTAEPAVMMALPIGPEAVAQIVAMRREGVIRSLQQIAPLVQGYPGYGRLGTAAGSILTFRATATLRLPNGQFSDIRKTVAATVKFPRPEEANVPHQVMRWYDNATTELPN